MNTGERRNMSFTTGVRQVDALGPLVFTVPVGIILQKFRTRFDIKEAETMTYMDDMATFCIEINPVTVQAVTFFKEELRKVDVTISET